METHTGTSQVAAAPPKPKPAGADGVAPTALTARQQKRMKWWFDSTDKRLGPLPDADGAVKPENAEIVKKVEGKPKNPKYPPREVAVPFRGSGKGKNGEVKKKEDRQFTVFVGQIPYDAKEEEVKKIFETAGVIKNFRWRTNPETKKFKGFAFVEYENKKSFARAFQLHHTVISGRPVNVEATIVGGRKSRHRAENIKERTARLQKEGAEALALKKARVAAKLATNPTAADILAIPDTTDSTSTLHSKKRMNDTDTTSDSGAAVSKKAKQEMATSTDMAMQPPGQSRPNQRQRKRKFESKMNGVGGPTAMLPSVRHDTASLTEENHSTPAKDQAEAEKSQIHPTKAESGKSVGTEDSKAVNGNANAKDTLPDKTPHVNIRPAGFSPKPMVTKEMKPLVMSGVKPKESHLAALIAPRLHIKFE